MAITTSGNISLKETAGAANSIQTEVTGSNSGNASLATISAASNDYQDSDRGAVTPRDTDASPYGMLEFSGYTQASISTWPTISSGPNGIGGALPGASGTEIEYWGLESYINALQEADAWCRAMFWRDDTNNRIIVQMQSGTPAVLAAIYRGYITYTGMSSPTFYAKHSYSGSVTDVSNEASGYHYPDHSPNITKDTYRQMSSDGISGTLDYYWEAKRTTSSNTAAARVLNQDVVFTVKITSGGTDYTVSKDLSLFDVFLYALRGTEL